MTPGRSSASALPSRSCPLSFPRSADWLLGILSDERLQPADRFQDLLQRHVRSTLDGQPVLADPQPRDDAAVLAVIHWMSVTGTARLADQASQLTALQQRILKTALRTEPAALTIPQAAAIHRAVADILDASIDEMVLSRSQIGTVLRRFEAAIRRWRWDEDDLHDPIRWPVRSEREVQDILWLILRSVFDDVVDEETLPKVGHSTYRADFGLPCLGVLIEAKYARHHADFKKIEKRSSKTLWPTSATRDHTRRSSSSSTTSPRQSRNTT
jgi:REase_DpnII-MboI